MPESHAVEFFTLYFEYRSKLSQVTSIELALEDIKQKYSLTEVQITELRNYIMEAMEPVNE